MVRRMLGIQCRADKPGIHPVTKQVIKGKPKKLGFYLPTSYTNPDSNGPEHLQTGNKDVLNRAAGILVKARSRFGGFLLLTYLLWRSLLRRSSLR